MLKKLYRRWLQFSEILARVMSRLILTLLYFLLIFPMGLLLRVCGKDPLHKYPSSELKSYRIESPARDRNHYTRPY